MKTFLYLVYRRKTAGIRHLVADFEPFVLFAPRCIRYTDSMSQHHESKSAVGSAAGTDQGRASASDRGRDCHPDLPASLTAAICDDDPDDRGRLQQEISLLAGSRPLRFAEFADGKSLLDSAESFDIIFLDILMEGKNGLEIARAIRKQSNPAMIIFVTQSREHLVAGYEVEAFRYLLKPYTQSDLAAVLEKAFARLDKRGFVVRSGGSVYRIPFEHISYIEAQGRRCLLILTDGSQLSIGEGISQVEKQINPELLIRCQKSFIVNLGQIASLRRYEATLRSGAVIPIGRRLWSEVQDRFISFLALD